MDDRKRRNFGVVERKTAQGFDKFTARRMRIDRTPSTMGVVKGDDDRLRSLVDCRRLDAALRQTPRLKPIGIFER